MWFKFEPMWLECHVCLLDIELFRGAATYVDKILKGVKPGDLPVQEPTKFELIVNLKNAKVIGIDVPTSLLLRADEVIE
jgi:putative ABC transport system substrate-binding protein